MPMFSLLAWPIRVLRDFRQSIAYLTSLIILFYLSLGLFAVLSPIDESQLPGFLKPLTFDDPDTARTLLATLVGGMISLVVFSFSMVMSVLSQAGSNFSLKLVFSLVTERRHQQVLGHYLGTILFILILLMVPMEGDTPDLWRSLAVNLGAGMVIGCLALFVYFIHNASQSVQINAVTQGLHRSTRASMERLKTRQQNKSWRHLSAFPVSEKPYHWIYSDQSGYIQNANLEELAKLAEEINAAIHLNFSFGDYTIKAFPLLKVEADQTPSEAWCTSALSQLEYVEGESVKSLYVNGLTQLMEVAIKALSPGINDPGTARLCIHQITELLCQRLSFQPSNTLTDDQGRIRVTWPEERFNSLLYKLFTPILYYGRSDVSICLSLLKALKTLSLFAENEQLDVIQAHAERVVKALSELHNDSLDQQFIAARLNNGEHRLTLPKSLPLNTAN
ncbi:DUF2254 domain-containing protein [Vreelandella rituensis]|uniref:DUF2254 domain-containing protein n=2 Tax=Vreelandella rituensis TaxID=2282306 RepID=A0A368TQI5_9GAMM|nr:DUF2254 domain-containing protein [Halomonas rituensis]